MLVVEDEPLLMMMAVDVVEAVGLEALEATNADDAVLILERRSDIAIVLTEVEVPGTMDGRKMAPDRDRRRVGEGDDRQGGPARAWGVLLQTI